MDARILCVQLELYEDGQTSGDTAKRAVSVGDCVKFTYGNDYAIGLIHRFLMDRDGELSVKLQLFKDREELPLSMPANFRPDVDHELFISNESTVTPVSDIASLVRVLDVSLWQQRFTDSPATPVEDLDYFSYRHYTPSTRKLVELKRPFLPGAHPIPRVPCLVCSNNSRGFTCAGTLTCCRMFCLCIYSSLLPQGLLLGSETLCVTPLAYGLRQSLR